MSLAAALKDGPPKHSWYGRGCVIGRWSATAPPAEVAALDAMIADPAWTHSALARLVSDDPDTDLTLRPDTMRRHRVGECTCAR